ALRALQSGQAATQFVQLDVPPCDRGTTWSTVIRSQPGCAPQYWHVWWSRLATFRRLNDTAVEGSRSYRVRQTTSGARSLDRPVRTTIAPSRGSRPAHSSQA